MDDMLTMQVWHQSGYSIITVAGEIDIVTAPGLRERLAVLADSGRPVIADLDQVSFIDAAGLHVLAAAARLAAARGGSLHVVSAQHQVRRIFALTGLDRQLPLTRTRAEALAGCATWCWLPVTWPARGRGRERRSVRDKSGRSGPARELDAGRAPGRPVSGRW